MKSGFKLVLISLPITALGGGISAVVMFKSPPQASIELAERASAVRVVIAESKAISPNVRGFGLVILKRTFQAIAEVSGTVEYVNPALKDGQILPEDVVLVRLHQSISTWG